MQGLLGAPTMPGMGVVLAALDNSLAVNPVLVSARALARLLGDRVEAIHVVGEGAEAAEEAAFAAGVPLRLASGPVVEQLVEAGRAPGVSVLVIGARGTTGTGHPLGSTALAVVASLRSPVVVVPPAGKSAPRIRRVLLPLAGATSDQLTPLWKFEPTAGSIVDVIVRDLGERGEELVSAAARAASADLVVLGWINTLSGSRAPIAVEALRDAEVPVMLIPVHEGSRLEESAPG